MPNYLICKKSAYNICRSLCIRVIKIFHNIVRGIKSLNMTEYLMSWRELNLETCYIAATLIIS